MPYLIKVLEKKESFIFLDRPSLDEEEADEMERVNFQLENPEFKKVNFVSNFVILIIPKHPHRRPKKYRKNNKIS